MIARPRSSGPRVEHHRRAVVALAVQLLHGGDVFVDDRATKKNLAGEMKFAGKLRMEMKKRGVITRTRPAVGPHPGPGDILFFAPPLVVSAGEIDRLVTAARGATKAALGA